MLWIPGIQLLQPNLHFLIFPRENRRKTRMNTKYTNVNLVSKGVALPHVELWGRIVRQEFEL